MLLLLNKLYKIEINYRLITGSLCELCFYNKLTVDMLNKEIIYNRFKFILIIVIINLFISSVSFDSPAIRMF